MNNLEKYLFKHILNAKIAPTRLEDAQNVDWSPVPEEEVPTDYTWVQSLFPLLGVALVTLIVKLAKLARKKPDKPPSHGPQACAKKALEILIRNITNMANNGDPDAVAIFSLLKDLLDKLDDECKREFLALPEAQKIIQTIGSGLGLTGDEVLERLKDKTPEGLIAIAAIYLRTGAQNAAIRMYVLAKGGNEELANWLVGLGLTVAAIIALGAALAAGSVILDLTGVGLPAGIAVGTASAIIIALGIWLQQNQGNNNSGNSA
jgi:hypothetical protein